METTTMNKVYKVFPGGKFKVLTFSYDDGKLEDRRLVKLFNKYNLKATFNLDTGIIDPAIRIPQEEWSEVYAGHDIAVHTFTHPTMIRLYDYAALKEILEDKDNLEKIFKRPIYGLAYIHISANLLLREWHHRHGVLSLSSDRLINPFHQKNNDSRQYLWFYV